MMNPSQRNQDPDETRQHEGSADDTHSLGEDTSHDQRGVPADPKQWVGHRLGKYEINELLGVGGMGVVLKAYDTSIERDIAIKVLPAEFSSEERALGRFLAEARSAGQLSHAHTVTVHEIAQYGQTHYLVMEYVAGGSVRDQLNHQGAYSVADATRIAIEACKGISAAHEHGLVHRDIKPANLMLTQDGTVKVSDFGIAKHTNRETLQMTQTGQLVGTPHFMSPEQCESQPVDARSDLYSLGATYYSLLTGKAPYEGSGSVAQVLFAHCKSPVPDPRDVRTDVPPACSQIIERAMAIDPKERYQSAEEMRADLEAVLSAISGAGIRLPSDTGSSVPTSVPVERIEQPRRWTIAMLSVLAIVVVAVVAYFGFRGDGTESLHLGEADSNSELITSPTTGDPIKVGILHSLTGTMAKSESPVVDATLLALERLNEKGGVLGRRIEGVVADGKSDPAAFASEAKRLIEKEEVCTIFGGWSSAGRKTLVPILEELDHLLVYPVQYEGIEESPNVIYTGGAPNQQIIPAVKWAYAFKNKRKFFLIGSDYVFPRVAHEIIKDQLQILGAELVGEEFVLLGSTDFGPVVEKIVRAQPDVILNCINGDTNTAFFTQLRAAGIQSKSTPTISFSIGEEQLDRLDLSALTGDYAVWSYFQSIETKENDQFVAAFHEKYGEERSVTDPMEAAWFGVTLWAKAVTEAGVIDAPSIRRAMLNQRMQAPSGQVRIDPATQHTFKTPRIGRVQSDGQFEIVWTGVKPEPPNPYPETRTTQEWRALLHDLYAGWGNQWSPNEK